MPLGLQRLNALPSQHPTPHIVFIKPLPGATSSESETFLSRVAALCHPILSKHHLSVISLEEFPPNREFLGRNFNAGECIQLVIRSAGGRLLPLRHVAMVMVHELAHCMQMNHSRAFWAVRDGYADDMRALWGRGYQGEGFWGRGRALDAETQDGLAGADLELPAEVCGGAYRGRRSGRKRKRAGADKQKVTYAERQQRRIARKFGAGGTALGEDDAVRMRLMRGRKGSPFVKPRVAQSERGRELRAQAALARLEQHPGQGLGRAQGQGTLAFKPEASPEANPGGAEADDSESEYEDADSGADTDAPVATGADGGKLKDEAGRDLVKVCSAEEGEDAFIKSEREELQDLWNIPVARPEPDRGLDMGSGNRGKPPKDSERKGAAVSSPARIAGASAGLPKAPGKAVADIKRSDGSPLPIADITCPACSLANSALSLTCEACGCVLHLHKAPGSWKCSGQTCQGVVYINSGDSSRCGICGAGKA